MPEPDEETAQAAILALLRQYRGELDELTATVSALWLYAHGQRGFDKARFDALETACRLRLAARPSQDPISLGQLIEVLLRDLGPPS